MSRFLHQKNKNILIFFALFIAATVLNPLHARNTNSYILPFVVLATTSYYCQLHLLSYAEHR